eukprot:676193-Pelagomonas_calceolata.AAC.3
MDGKWSEPWTKLWMPCGAPLEMQRWGGWVCGYVGMCKGGTGGARRPGHGFLAMPPGDPSFPRPFWRALFCLQHNLWQSLAQMPMSCPDERRNTQARQTLACCPAGCQQAQLAVAQLSDGEQRHVALARPLLSSSHSYCSTITFSPLAGRPAEWWRAKACGPCTPPAEPP